MKAVRNVAAALTAILVSLEATALNVPPAPPDQRVVRATLQVLRAAGFTGRVSIAVADRNAQRARLVMDHLVAVGSTESPPMTIDPQQVAIPEVGDVSPAVGAAVAVIVSDATPKAMAALTTYSAVKHRLTISFRPQDVGTASVVVVPTPGMAPAGIYYYEAQLSAERVSLDQQIRPKGAAVVADDDREPYAEARRMRIKGRSDPDWVTIVIKLRTAIVSHFPEVRRPVPLDRGGQNDPYLPHLRLSEALSYLGDCDGAQSEYDVSNRYPSARAGLSPNEVEAIRQMVVQCPMNGHRALMPRRQSEGLWATSSF